MANIKLPDIDIDVADRDELLNVLTHIPATIQRTERTVKHKTGVYFNAVPLNEISGNCGVDHRVAESRGYFKWDILNMSVYNRVKNPQHLKKLLNIPTDWTLIYDFDFCKKIVHIGDHYNSLIKLCEPVDSIEKMAMFLAIIRPSKKYLLTETWEKIREKIWMKEDTDDYMFSKPHAIAYATLVSVDINLYDEIQNNG